MTSSSHLEQLKAKGNAAFSAGNYAEAIMQFTEAITADPSNQVFYSNRSAAYASMKSWDLALEDAEKAIELKPDWSKGYGRKAAALFGMENWSEAKESYKQALELEPDNQQLKKGLETVEQKLTGSEGMAGSPFSSSDIWGKLAASPKTSHLLAQQDFVNMIQDIQKNPNSMTKYMKDPRFFAAFGAIMGIDIQTASTSSNLSKEEESEDEVESIGNVEKEQTKIRPDETLKSQSKSSMKENKEKELESSNDQKMILKEKDLGNEAYKNKEFSKALEHYESGLSIDPQNISLWLNKSAVFYESERLDECIEACTKVIDLGRDQHADFKILAKAFARIGSTYQKKDDLDNAIKYFNKSLAESRNAEVLEKLKTVERIKKQKERESYLDPKISEQERNKGNELFKKGNFVEAISCYNEAIKRDDSDPRNYTNRAACYLKLVAIPEGLKDAEKAIELDPSFTKGYIRKAALLFAKRDYATSLEFCEQASSHDKDGKNSIEITTLIQKCYQEISKQSHSTSSQSDEEKLKKAMENPEVRQIMNDPVMVQILKQMQSNPEAIQEHMRNPVIANKVRKLMAAGIIQTR